MRVGSSLQDNEQKEAEEFRESLEKMGIENGTLRP